MAGLLPLKVYSGPKSSQEVRKEVHQILMGAKTVRNLFEALYL